MAHKNDHFNKELFAKVLLKAIGKPDRSLSKFARQCGITPSYMSRMLNCKVPNSPGNTIIKKIALHAANAVTYDELMLAVGYAPLAKEETDLDSGGLQKVKAVFPGRLALLRKQTNITITDLSIAIGKKRQAVSQFELGVTLPAIDTLIDIANFFGVSIDYLVGRTNDPQHEVRSHEINHLSQRLTLPIKISEWMELNNVTEGDLLQIFSSINSLKKLLTRDSKKT